MAFQLRYSSSARHSLNRIPRETALKFISELESLAEEDNPVLFLKRLQGFENPPLYSLRIGRYRVVMSVLNDIMVIHVVEIGCRSSVYRKF